MNNKKLGTKFEREMVEILKSRGYWVHFLSPDSTGAQPFDLIFAQDGIACVADCKTSKDHIFRITRLEWNQRMAFEVWKKKGNLDPVIFVKYNGKIKMVMYSILKTNGKVDLDAL